MLCGKSGGGHVKQICSNERMSQRATCLRQGAQLGRSSNGRRSWKNTEMSLMARNAGADLASKQQQT